MIRVPAPGGRATSGGKPQLMAVMVAVMTLVFTLLVSPMAEAATWRSAATPQLAGVARARALMSVEGVKFSPTPDRVTYTWYRVSPTGKTTRITGATSRGYRLTPAEIGATVRVKVTAHKAGYTARNVWTKPSDVVKPSNFARVPTPKIIGTIRVGNTVRADAGTTWSPTPDRFSYQWYRIDSKGVSRAISGASSRTYAIKPADQGYRLRVRVTAVKATYANRAALSLASIRVPVLPPRTEVLDLRDGVADQSCKWVNNTGYSFRSTTVTPFNTVDYGSGMGCQIVRGDAVGWVDFLRPEWASRLQIVAGVPDDSPNSDVRVEVVVTSVANGVVLARQESRLGNPLNVDLNVSGQSRVRVEVRGLGAPVGLSPTGAFAFAGKWVGAA